MTCEDLKFIPDPESNDSLHTTRKRKEKRGQEEGGGKPRTAEIANPGERG